MSRAFHDRPFDAGTKIKLEIFRRYVRKWLPVFLTKPKVQKQRYSRVNIYDLFSGPGRDKLGVSGSPLIVQEEIRSYCLFCKEQGILKAGIPFRMVFSDIKKDNIENLKQVLQKNRCPNDCCTYEYNIGPFSEVLDKYLPEMRNPDEANLVILDQRGVREVTPEIVKALVNCGFTDVLFFISTSALRRFAAEPEMQAKFQIDPNLSKIEGNDTIHRYICRHFRDELAGTGLELAPFSLKKGPNVYGVIFASSHLSGLERFLAVCWKIDPTTGEANFNIEGDPGYAKQSVLFSDPDHMTKTDRFERDLLEFIGQREPINHALYGFCLGQGFPAAKANESLRRLQKTGKLHVFNALDGSPARKGSFYLKDNELKVIFKVNQP